MTTREYLLSQLGQEAAEVIQMTSKCALFGTEEIYEHESNPLRLTNAQRLKAEIYDFIALAEKCQLNKILEFESDGVEFSEAIMNKSVKVDKYMARARQLGTLKD